MGRVSGDQETRNQIATLERWTAGPPPRRPRSSVYPTQPLHGADARHRRPATGARFTAARLPVALALLRETLRPFTREYGDG